MGRRSKYSAKFKAKVAIEAIKERETLTELSTRFDVSPVQITSWKNEFLKHSDKAFESEIPSVKKIQQANERLHSKIGKLQTEADFFAEACKDAGLKIN